MDESAYGFIDEPDVDVPTLRKAVEWVEWQETLGEENPDRVWYQSVWLLPLREVFTEEERARSKFRDWSCETAMCMAGYIALNLADPDPEYKPHIKIDGRVVDKYGNEYEVEHLALATLGLSEDYGMFVGHNTAADIRQIAESIVGGAL